MKQVQIFKMNLKACLCWRREVYIFFERGMQNVKLLPLFHSKPSINKFKFNLDLNLNLVETQFNFSVVITNNKNVLCYC